ncbi:MAG: CerR family C-terminal domain-containing protein [Planctomycetota bacterium]
MSQGAQSEADTRQRVLESATQLFADNGFHETTVHEICDAAQANIAAVNYYFGSKRQLYDAAWRHAYQLTSEATDLNPQWNQNRPPEELIKAFIKARVRDAFSEGPSRYFWDILMKEHAEPTSVHRDIILEVLKPQGQRLTGLVGTLVGLEPEDQRVWMCVFSLVGQLAFINAHRRIARRLFGDRPPVPLDPEVLIEHYTRMFFAGLRATREAAEGRDEVTAATGTEGGEQ